MSGIIGTPTGTGDYRKRLASNTKGHEPDCSVGKGARKGHARISDCTSPSGVERGGL